MGTFKWIVVAGGSITVLVTNLFLWEVVGLIAVIVTLLIPQKKMKFRKVND